MVLFQVLFYVYFLSILLLKLLATKTQPEKLFDFLRESEHSCLLGYHKLIYCKMEDLCCCHVLCKHNYQVACKSLGC
uniref:Uncharacterized protein n=1 Tax=Arundo donax TaxID=35708 RepID=A0A0A9CW73_ARUDO